MVFRAVVFTFVPTAVELVLVCFLLARIFQPIIAIMVVATFAAYVLWTAQLTRAAAKVRWTFSVHCMLLYLDIHDYHPNLAWESLSCQASAQASAHISFGREPTSRYNVQSRQQVNELDNLTTGKAVDALLNYETVKLFNNERLEVPLLI